MKEFFVRGPIIVTVFSILVGCGTHESEINPLAEIGKTAVVKGKVTAIDTSAMARDGDGVLHIFTVQKNKIVVLVPTGFSPPSPKSRDVFLTLKKGDDVEVAGEVTGKNKLTISLVTHYLKKVDVMSL